MNVWSCKLAGICSIVALTICLHGQTQQKVDAQSGGAGARNPFDGFRSFSATMNGGIGGDHDRKIYRLGDLMRADFDDSYRITDLQKLTMWGVQRATCSEFAMPDAAAFPFSAYHDHKVARSPTAEKETVDGHVCAIENVTFTPSNGMPVVIKMKLWEAEDLEGFPVKIEAEANGRRMNIAYTDVSLKAPDAKLFQHPAKCASGPQPGQKGTIRLDAPKTAPKQPQKPPQQ